MNTIRDKLHLYIDKAGDKKIRAIFTLLENEINGTFTEKEIGGFIKRRALFLNDQSETYSAEESINLLKKKKK